MAASWNDTVLDGSLDVVINGATAMALCEGQPLTFADATTDKGSGGMRLATAAIAGGDWTKGAAGSGTGRQMEVGEKSPTPTVSGTADHIAFVSGSVLLQVIQTTPTVVTAGTPVTYPLSGTAIQYNRDLLSI